MCPVTAIATFLTFKISTVEYLQTVKENRLEKFTIIVDSTVIDETLVNDIKTLVENDEARHSSSFRFTMPRPRPMCCCVRRTARWE